MNDDITVISIYGILIFFGFLFSVLFAYIEWRKNNYSKFKFILLFGWGSFFALFGARWWYLAFNPSDYVNFFSIFQINTGRSILGSMFFGAGAVFIFCKFWIPEVEWRRAFSIILPNMLLGQAIGRWGNFYNQEVYGLAVDSLNWLPQYIQDGMFIDGQYRQPLFLYESILNIFGWIFILCIMKPIKWFKPGTHGAMYFLWYGIVRASMELFRDPSYIMHINEFPTSFFLAIIFAVVGFFTFIYYQFIYEKYTAVFIEFKLPYKRNQFFMNLKSISKFLIFKINWDDFKNQLKINKKNYQNHINNIDSMELITFNKKISSPY